jgi:hypothetical protein
VPRGKYEDDAERCLKKREKREERGQASDNVMKNRQEIKMFSIAIHTL